MTTTTDRSHAEAVKDASRGLRGTIADALERVETGAIPDDDQVLTKFHGLYLEDDRDLRAERRRKRLEKAYSFMVRVRVPAGRVSPAQWLALDRLATERANGTLRLTTRQAVQFHGVIKTNLRRTVAGINAALLDTLAACGDVNRNVMSAANPRLGPVHAEAAELARRISDHLSPRTRAYHEIWVDGAPAGGGPVVVDEEPVYGRVYLPRKFKTVVAVPPLNDVDVFAHDLGFIAIVADGRIIGYDVAVGGGLAMTHGEPDTFPRLAEVIGFAPPDRAVAVAEAVVTLQRDFGDRADRRHARLKYTIARRGTAWFKAELEARLGHALEPARPFAFERTGDGAGWITDARGRGHYTLLVESGRVRDTPDRPMRTGLARIAAIHTGEFVITPNQNLIIADVDPAGRAAIDALLAEHGLAGAFSGLRRNAMACVALPTCSQALAEAERFLPELLASLEAVVERAGLRDDEIVIRVTGCPNGCARPYLAEIGIVGRAPGVYAILLGGGFDGGRPNRLWRADVPTAEIAPLLAPLIEAYARRRAAGERFGDFLIRTRRIPRPTGAPAEFHVPAGPAIKSP